MRLLNACRQADYASPALPLFESRRVFFVHLVTSFLKPKSDSGSCFVMPFGISGPEGIAPVKPRPHRINSITAKEVDATLDQ